MGSKELPRIREFAKNRTLGHHVREISEMGGQKMGSNMRPRYIRFHDIHDRDISGLHCIVIYGWSFSCEIVLNWISLDLTDH